MVVLSSLLKVTATDVAGVQDAELVGVATDEEFVTRVEEAAAVEVPAGIELAKEDEVTIAATAIELAADVESAAVDEIATDVKPGCPQC